MIPRVRLKPPQSGGAPLSTTRHFFPCDHCHYPHNASDFERSNAIMIAHLVLTAVCDETYA